ncbi:MAG: nucleotidyltransferase domain-containing protein [Lentisphaerae bacterium]|nr:nucleotidyltransferase domain-containing protein [Lentisphaerota bacterium]
MRVARIDGAAVGRAFAGADVLGVWVFGSASQGEIRAGADFDIGVLFGRRPKLDELAEIRARLQEALAFEEIDLTVLDVASPILRFEAMRGRRVLCADKARCAEFASLTAREYEDEMALSQRWLHAAVGFGSATKGTRST